MGKGSPDPPAAPDPAETAAAQSAANRETAIAQARLNQINETTPFGTSTFRPTGKVFDGIPQFERVTTLDPTDQERLDAERRVGAELLGIGEDQLGRIRTTFDTPLDLSGLPAAPSLETGVAERDAVTEALLARLNPEIERGREALETRLLNQGFTRGTEGFNEAFDEFNRQQNDLRLQATLAGGAEQNRIFGLAASERERALQEDLLERNTPLNELSALLGTSPGITLPQFSPAPQTGIAPTDVIGAQNLALQADIANFNAQSQARNAALGGLFGLGGAALGGVTGSKAFGNFLFG